MGLGEGGRKRGPTNGYLVGLPSHKNLGEAVESFLVNKKVALKAAWKSGPDPPATRLPTPSARTGRTPRPSVARK